MILAVRFLIAVGLINICFGVETDIQNCPKKSTKFEKIIGLPTPDLHNKQILFQPSNNNNNSYSITLDCISACQINPICQSFVLFYKDLVCYWFDNNKVNFSDRDEGDSDSAWFVKICLEQDSKCPKKWIFESIKGATLVGDNTKILPHNVSKTDCEQTCLDERDFDCKSIKFKVNPDHADEGVCILSKNNRYLVPNAYRVSSDDDYYLENQCNEIKNADNRNKDFCAYEEYQDTLFLHGDRTFENTSKEDCGDLCESTEEFRCRGFSVVKETCVLHSEDTKVRGPRILTPVRGATYYERARCLNINITCNDTFLSVSYQPEGAFQGKVYMQGFSENPKCFARKNGKINLVSLQLSLREDDCGIIKAESAQNRSLLTGMLIIQYNPFIQTQSDRLIKVGCVFTNENDVLLGTGISISPNYSSKGSKLINTYNTNLTAARPMVEMHVIDMDTQQATSSSQIGQALQLIIEMTDKNDSYDFWASRLIAMTEKGEESIFLLDDKGCPTNPDIFPPLQKLSANGTKLLTAIFQAFKFASSPVIKLSVMVHFCPNKECPRIDCGSLKNDSFSVRNGRDLGSEAYITNNTSQTGIPLEYTMSVTDLNYNPSKFTLDHHGTILVAGFNSSTNEVCMDYNLVIGLIITWILVQLLFIISAVSMLRRYKKHYKELYAKSSMETLHNNFGLGFSNLGNKRVRLAEADLM